MKVKTYGVPGLSEWYGKVKAGNIEVEVQFKGGTASPSGAQPAYFVTKDPITQFVIENSKQFKQGFIILVMQHELPGEHPRIAVPKPKPAKPKDENPKGDEAGVAAAGAAAQETGRTEVTDETEDAEEAAAQETGRTEVTDETEDAAQEGGKTKVKVASLDEAKAYLVDHHGCKASDLRSKAKIVAAAAERDIEFIGI